MIVLYYCITVSLYLFISVLLYYCSIVLLYDCIIVLLHYCIVLYRIVSYCIEKRRGHKVQKLACSFRLSNQGATARRLYYCFWRVQFCPSSEIMHFAILCFAGGTFRICQPAKSHIWKSYISLGKDFISPSEIQKAKYKRVVVVIPWIFGVGKCFFVILVIFCGGAGGSQGNGDTTG